MIIYRKFVYINYDEIKAYKLSLTINIDTYFDLIESFY